MSGGMYAITCKKEYYDTWVQELKNGLDSFATVEVVDVANMVFYDKYPIYSPSKKYSIELDTGFVSEHCRSDINVYIVSDGGYLLLWGDFFEDEAILNILIQNWEIIDDKIFYEMYYRTTSILDKMADKERLPPPPKPTRSSTIRTYVIWGVLLLYLLCALIVWIVNYVKDASG